MSSCVKIDNIVKLMITFNLEIDNVPDDLRCAKCKSVLKNAWQVSCGCKFCRICIDLMETLNRFCPGGSQECNETPLSTAVPDYGANKSVSKLIAKCPQISCSYECSLVDMESHLKLCPRKSMDCPFRELGCLQDKLATEDMSNHLQQDSRSHNEILIGMIVDMKREMDMLKRDLLLKDEEMRHVENENKYLKNEIKLIKDEIKCINVNMDSMKSQIKPTSVQVPLNQVTYEWLIDEPLGDTDWTNVKTSDKFTGVAQPYTYNLIAWNRGNFYNELWIELHILSGPSDSILKWPFSGTVTVTVMDRYNRYAFRKQTGQRQIQRPIQGAYSYSDPLKFGHSVLKGAGLNLGQGVHVSCQIVSNES